MYNQGQGSGPPSWQSQSREHSTGMSGLPSRPSAPHTAHIQTSARPYNTSPAYAYARPAIPFLITNPYAPTQITPETLGIPLITSEGYTLSSTFSGTSANRQFVPRNNFQSGGNIPCTRQGCSYLGRSNKDVELHMMDRHFIYPPGHNQNAGKKRKRDGQGVSGPDGDASRHVSSKPCIFLCTGTNPMC